MNESDIDSLFDAIDEIKNSVDACIPNENEAVSNEDLGRALENFEGTLEKFMSRLETSHDRFNTIMEEAQAKSIENEKRFNNMILQLKGCISKSTSLFKMQKKEMPVRFLLEDSFKVDMRDRENEDLTKPPEV